MQASGHDKISPFYSCRRVPTYTHQSLGPAMVCAVMVHVFEHIIYRMSWRSWLTSLPKILPIFSTCTRKSGWSGTCVCKYVMITVYITKIDHARPMIGYEARSWWLAVFSLVVSLSTSYCSELWNIETNQHDVHVQSEIAKLSTHSRVKSKLILPTHWACPFGWKYM